ncbi:follicular dendritic cell secreted peptide [Dromiciops gliroides]|uniref:follicular dendritic cell secreted peptide n=1 Tax=Dromiciops gliroides TaxID=33562 RepID=UPI001CC63124|nr:follicular dendritic cell secreted peptide [Dromiciops gliroides]
MKAFMIIAVIAITLGSLAAQDQEREKRSLSSESDELRPWFYRPRYQYPFGPYQPFGYPGYGWPRYYFIPVPPPAVAAPPNKK